MPAMTSPTGLPVGAIHGFTRDVLDLIEKRRPDYLICAFDHPGDTFRHELFSEYKAQRPEMPSDLQPQIAPIREMLQALGIPSIDQPGFEADDILATIAREVAEQGGECLLVTADKDCRQLISERTKIFQIRKNEVFDAQALRDTWGIRPDQVVDFQALTGDPVDGIPGVPLVGPKLARDLLEKYDTLDNLYQHLQDINAGKRRENLETYREQVLMSRELVRLRADLCLAIDWSQALISRPGRIQRQRVTELCSEFGFRRLADRLGQSATETITTRPLSWQPISHAIRDWNQWQLLVAQLQAASRVALALAIEGNRPHELELRGFALAVDDQQGWQIEWPGQEQTGLRILQDLFARKELRLVVHDIKRARNLLCSLGIASSSFHDDSLVADYLLNAGQRSHAFGELVIRYLKLPGACVELDPTAFKRMTTPSSDGKGECVGTKNLVRAAIALWRLDEQLQRELTAQGLQDLYRNVELPLTEVLSAMEMVGISIDCERLRRLSERLGTRLAELKQEIYSLAGGEFNIDSPAQLSQVLFDDLGLKSVKKTKTGRSTDMEVLEELADVHPLPRRIVEYRQLSKLKHTYADTLPLAVTAATGRIHTTLKQDVAATGRLSSFDPNLQNIPVRTALGTEIRAAFVARDPKWLLMAADYSQIELRVLAHFSGDAALIAAFEAGEDIHRRVAAEVFGVDQAAVTIEMRRAAKAVNFGILYGQSGFGLAKSLGISVTDAEAYITAYFARYPGVEQFINNILDDAAQNGYIQTILGRRRVIQGVRSPSRRVSRQKNLPERLAINSIIQGSAADLIKVAMIRIHGGLERENFRARMMLQIHDELLFEFPEEERERLAVLVSTEMAHAGDLRVRLEIDVKTGRNWAECEPWKV